MAYFMLYETATGRPISLSSVEADPIRAGRTSVDIGSAPSPDTMWDNATRAFIPRPPKVFVDRIEDLKNLPGMNSLWNKLKPADKTTLQNALITLLGSERFRGGDNPEVIE